MTRPDRTSPWMVDIAAVASFLALAWWVTDGLLARPAYGIANNGGDQAFFEFALSHGAQVLFHGADPFTSQVMGSPVGVNMMANTSVLGISIPLAPITQLLGARAAFDVALLGGLIGTAASWYFVVSRPLLGSRAAGYAAGLLCGFGPAMISHSNSHLNLIGQALVPLLIWRAVELRRPGRWLRNGLWLALFAVWQYFVSPELLLMLAVGIGIAFLVIAALCAQQRRAWRAVVLGVLVAGAVSGVVLAYPLWVQFRGAGSYSQVPYGYRIIDADPLSFFLYSRQSLSGTIYLGQHLATNPTEENTFLGLPLVVLLLVTVALLRRRPAVIGVFVAALACALFSLGPQLMLWGRYRDVTLPWHYAQRLPLFSSMVPSRWGLVLLMAAGLLVAALVREYAGTPRRWWVGAALLVALLPLFPKPLPLTRLTPAPTFITSGEWKQYTSGGRTLMFLPMASNVTSDPIRWSAEQLDAVHLSQGYFLGPGSDGTAILGSPGRPLSDYIGAVGNGADIPVSPVLRIESYIDLAYWRVGAVVLIPTDPVADAYRRAMTRLLGFEPALEGGVEVWDVSRVDAQVSAAR